jgi:insertion element IS1 protein InsB
MTNRLTITDSFLRLVVKIRVFGILKNVEFLTFPTIYPVIAQSVRKAQKRWLWTAICRRTRQIVAFVSGDRSRQTGLRLWNKLPEDDQACQSFSDFWKADHAFPEPHHQVDKASGETALVENWNTRLRQRLGRYVRKTLSFSKSDAFHQMVTKWFIVEYNLSISSLTP